ncbi:hypothetical protein QVD99_006431 [Batrachochytrium dendrobatidis]|nr:hypothetical protein QVD99_006431 [Batrachochytrium dendrobatidis]
MCNIKTMSRIRDITTTCNHIDVNGSLNNSVMHMQTTVALLTCVIIVVELDCDRIRDSEYNKCVYRVVLTTLTTSTVKHNISIAIHGYGFKLVDRIMYDY